MEKRIIAYRKRIDKLLQGEDADWQKVLEEHLIQVGFFQHERLIHLIVTVTFAVLEMISNLFSFLLFWWGVVKRVLGCFSLFLLVLLIPYIRHYYILENEVQKMYAQYDRILEKINR